MDDIILFEENFVGYLRDTAAVAWDKSGLSIMTCYKYTSMALVVNGRIMVSHDDRVL